LIQKGRSICSYRGYQKDLTKDTELKAKLKEHYKLADVKELPGLQMLRLSRGHGPGRQIKSIALIADFIVIIASVVLFRHPPGAPGKRKKRR
jgi:hypothetical protein